ncbi:TIGR01457 family HAD-type hydrolase [Pisciglobus halotolerans]|uniref:4-nitrophenyl phosphatase n=1 Tax=Pisciglobus halotolerans TaxID=745365 RepID=A0A1I3DK76_9LACT|nr:TIGR01457 family HAD-type hydrolase [Pisciglobus halotolerans]SFH87073.1 4-nitrophenyl phosphatase [Pisciglobus halotolerans]
MKYKGYLIDLDGTMYRGKEPIPEAPDFIHRLREAKIPFLFVTNNSTKTPEDVAANLQDNFGIEAHVEEIFTSSLATAAYLKSLHHGEKVYTIGEKGLKEALSVAGFKEDEINPDYVVVGLDQKVTYEELKTATLAIRNGARYVVTNRDTNLPTEIGLVPGAGSLAALLTTATRVEPTFVGKPETLIMEQALERIKLSADEVLMVGDNYETDILAGIRSHIDTLLVFTGFTSREDLEKVEVQPTYQIDSLKEWTVE